MKTSTTKISHGFFPFTFLAGMALAAVPDTLSAEPDPAVARENKATIQKGFDHWANRTGNFFDLLTDNVKWTVAGSSRFSKTYVGKKQFVDELIVPLNQRLSALIVPKVTGLYADGDTVVAFWDGTATAKDGRPYLNSYAWRMKMQHSRIVEVVAFFDTADLTDIWDRVPASE